METHTIHGELLRRRVRVLVTAPRARGGLANVDFGTGASRVERERAVDLVAGPDLSGKEIGHQNPATLLQNTAGLLSSRLVSFRFEPEDLGVTDGARRCGPRLHFFHNRRFHNWPQLEYTTSDRQMRANETLSVGGQVVRQRDPTGTPVLLETPTRPPLPLRPNS